MPKNIKLSEYFGLNKSQAELDFVDIYIDKDIPLFIDPWAIRQGNDYFSLECHSLVSVFFENIIQLVKKGEKSKALDLLNGLHEPKETHLGLSKSSFSGLGIGYLHAEEIYERLENSRAVKSGFLNDLEDTALMIEGIKEDKISDIVTNIIRFKLIKYTQEQCNFHGIQLRSNTPTGLFWDSQSLDWESSREDILIINGTPILLIPKFFVRKTLSIDPFEFFNIDILEFEQARYLDMGHSLCKTLKSGVVKKPPKKDLKEVLPKNIKEFIYDFSREHPKILEDYKERKSKNFTPLENFQIDEDLDIKKIVEDKKNDLILINTGTTDASKYENFIKGGLEIIFYPYLSNSTLHQRMNNGRKIIDICFQNIAYNGFFGNLPKIMIPCKEIYFECKNYSDDPANPEFDQLNGRFSNHTSQIGFLVCRKIENKSLFINRCKDFVKDKRHYIIGLEDNDIINLINLRSQGKIKEINEFFEFKLKEIQ